MCFGLINIINLFDTRWFATLSLIAVILSSRLLFAMLSHDYIINFRYFLELRFDTKLEMVKLLQKIFLLLLFEWRISDARCLLICECNKRNEVKSNYNGSKWKAISFGAFFLSCHISLFCYIELFSPPRFKEVNDVCPIHQKAFNAVQWFWWSNRGIYSQINAEFSTNLKKIFENSY